MSENVDQEAGNDNAAGPRINPRALVRLCVERLLKLDAIIASPDVETRTRGLAVWKVESVYRALHAVKDETGPPYTHARHMLVDRVFHFARRPEDPRDASVLVAAKLITLFPALSSHLSDEARLDLIEAAIRDERSKVASGKPEHAWASIARIWKGIEATDQSWRAWKSAWEKRNKAIGELIEAVATDD